MAPDHKSILLMKVPESKKPHKDWSHFRCSLVLVPTLIHIETEFWKMVSVNKNYWNAITLPTVALWKQIDQDQCCLNRSWTQRSDDAAVPCKILWWMCPWSDGSDVTVLYEVLFVTEEVCSTHSTIRVLRAV